MSKQDIIRNKLKKKVFDKFGKEVTIYRNGTPVYNDRGEIEEFATTSEQIIIVPWNTIAPNETQQPFGDLDEGSTSMAVEYNIDIQIGDIIEMEGIKYKINNINPNYLPGNVVNIVEAIKSQDL